MTDEVLEMRKVLELEAKAIMELRDQVGDEFKQVIDVLESCRGKVLLTGMGKSGLIARKIASTLSSTGTPSVYIHPAESSHGDLGVITPGDVVIALSHSGETPELTELIRYTTRKNIPLISLTKNKKSSLARASIVCLEVNVMDDACPMGLAPTSSTTATLALGDAIAVTLLKRKGFQSEDFAEFHPGGSLGKRLLTRVKDVMHSGPALVLEDSKTSMKTILSKMTRAEVRGTCAILDSNQNLIGAITDGDVRRALESGKDILSMNAEQLMSSNPKTIDPNDLAEKALRNMEMHSIQALLVVENGQSPTTPIGIVHIQDLLKAKIR